MNRVHTTNPLFIFSKNWHTNVDESFSGQHEVFGPDGQHLVAISDDSRRILLYDFKTGKWSDRITEPGARAYPTWSRDGGFLYFVTVATESPACYRVKLGQTRPELVVELKELKQFAGTLGSWSGVTPDGSPLTLTPIYTS